MGPTVVEPSSVNFSACAHKHPIINPAAINMNLFIRVFLSYPELYLVQMGLLNTMIVKER
jgi:hypothetical protein